MYMVCDTESLPKKLVEFIASSSEAHPEFFDGDATPLQGPHEWSNGVVQSLSVKIDLKKNPIKHEGEVLKQDLGMGTIISGSLSLSLYDYMGRKGLSAKLLNPVVTQLH